MSYLRQHTNRNNITQNEKLDDSQVKNRAGGYVYKITPWDQLNRFLILGTMGATYYASQKDMTMENLEVLSECLDLDGLRVVEMAVDVSVRGRAPKNDQAILVIAKACANSKLEVRKAAFEAMPKVCRIGTHLYQFVAFREDCGGGWGRLMKESVANWFNQKEAESVAYQVCKYKQRAGWSARDLLRKSHPKAATKEHNAVYKWVVAEKKKGIRNLPQLLKACNTVQDSTVAVAVKLIKEHNLPREVIPTEMLNDIKIWDALLEKMPVMALVRNLGKMSSIGLLKPNAARVAHVVGILNNAEAIKKSRIHPMNILTAMLTYRNGKGIKGSLTWTPNQDIISALEDAFYLSFENVVPTGKRTLIGIDISGSMTIGESGNNWGNISGLMGVPGLSPRIAAAALCMMTVRTEKVNCHTMGFSHNFVDIGITRKDSVEEACKKAQGRFGATDCSVPMTWALANKIEVDTFIVYTDNETYGTTAHVSQAMKNYRKQMGIDAKLIVCGMTATKCSIADPKDPRMLDLAGFDSATPKIISEFSRG